MSVKCRKGNSVNNINHLLKQRIIEYLSVQEDNSIPHIEDILAYLKGRYYEYARWKTQPLGAAVQKVLAFITLQNSKKSDTKRKKCSDSDSSDFDSDFKLVEYKDTNMLNASMRTMYHTAPQSPSPQKKKVKRSKIKQNKTSDTKWKVNLTTSTVTYKDIGGIDAIIQNVRELIEFPLIHPEIYEHIGVQPPSGVLLHGPPGCGKTLLAHAIASECRVSFLKIAATEIVSGMSGESEEKIRTIFKQAISCAPCLLFIDEIDSITPKRETAQREMERRIVAQLLLSMDSLSDMQGKPVIIIGATNRPDSLDPALRRAGRFDREIAINIPDTEARKRILSVISNKMKLDGAVDFGKIALKTSGYVGADLAALAKEAANLAISRIFKNLFRSESNSQEVLAQRAHVSDTLRAMSDPLTTEQLAPLSVTMDDFLNATKIVQPSSKREGFSTIPDITWNDIGALDELRKCLELAVVLPITKPNIFKRMGLTVPCGVLLYGPPGCGKTLVAKAIAHESGVSFISVKGPELLNKYVGESERAVRQVFQRARASNPCVMFFDELDALAPRRGIDGGNSVSERVVNQLLTEMDGLDDKKQVFVIAATNRPDIIDSALLRPGRLDKMMYVKLPTPEGRVNILQKHIRSCPIDESVDIGKIAFDPRCEGFSGADCAALVREATSQCIEEHFAKPHEKDPLVHLLHFEKALNVITPSVTKKDIKQYDRMHAYLRNSRSRVNIQNNNNDRN